MADTQQATAGLASSFNATSFLRSGGGPLPFATAFNIVNEGVSGTQIPFSYLSMPGNQPQQYGNTVFIWQTSAIQIPINTKPLNTWSVQGNNPDGDNAFTGLQVTELSYLLGYGVGTDPRNICAMAFLPATGSGGANPTTFQPSIQVSYTGSGTVAFNYVMPPGAKPQSDGDWVGIWRGLDESALYSTAPTAFVQGPQDFSSGSGAINGIAILRGTLYTLGYFRGGYDPVKPKQSTLACSVSWMG